MTKTIFFRAIPKNVTTLENTAFIEFLKAYVDNTGDLSSRFFTNDEFTGWIERVVVKEALENKSSACSVAN